MLVNHPESPVLPRAAAARAWRLNAGYASILAAFAMAPLSVSAAPDVQSAAASIPDLAQVTFDPAFITPAGQSDAVDLSRFERANIVLAGSYRVDLTVNGQWRGREDFTFAAVEGKESAAPCFDRAMLIRLGVDLDQAALGQAGADQTRASPAQPFPTTPFCGALSQYVAGAQVSFDMSEQKIDISVPQLYMKRSARGWVSPDRWDRGVPAALLSYTANTYQATNNGRSQTHAYVGLNGGINAGDWRLRHSGSLSWAAGGGRSGYQNSMTYLQRDISAAKAQLIIGDSYTSGALFDSIRFRGVQLASDERMLPDSQRGYAPVVRGTAESNAKVTIKQRGFILYETTVAPGPFEIDDLYPTGYGGDLTVTVTEANGQEKTFTVPFSATVQLLRPGVTRYSVTAGQIGEMGLRNKPGIVQATLQHGINNTFTAYTGGVASDGYLAALAGTAANTPVGAFSADLTAARTTLPAMIENGNSHRSAQGDSAGQSIRFGYSNNVNATGTNFSLAAYRYSTSGYLSLHDAVRVRDAAVRGDTGTIGRQRSRLDLNINQTLGRGYGVLYVTGSAISYWNNIGNQRNFSLGYSNNWKQISYNASVQRIRDLSPQAATASNRSNTQVSFSLSMPLGRAARAPTLNSSFSRSPQSGSNMMAGVSGTAGDNNQIGYGISATRQKSNDSTSGTGNANLQYNSSVANLSASASVGAGYRQTAFGAAGAVVAHPGGVLLAQSLGETIGIVHAPDATGAAVTNANAVRVNSSGYAVVPYLTPYQLNTIDLDPKNIPTDVELKATTQNVAPRAGAVVMLQYDTVFGRALLINALQANGQPVPFAASVFDAKGNSVGAVGQGSRVFARGMDDAGVLSVKWGGAPDQQCAIRYALPPKAKGRQEMVDQLAARCVPAAPAPELKLIQHDAVVEAK